uniref:Putative secreted protein n=1 Tax=Anopheles darlingi TaxID=43151 RepID=A0A2M4DBX5_ANODA
MFTRIARLTLTTYVACALFFCAIRSFETFRAPLTLYRPSLIQCYHNTPHATPTTTCRSRIDFSFRKTGTLNPEANERFARNHSCGRWYRR